MKTEFLQSLLFILSALQAAHTAVASHMAQDGAIFSGSDRTVRLKPQEQVQGLR